MVSGSSQSKAGGARPLPGRRSNLIRNTFEAIQILENLGKLPRQQEVRCKTQLARNRKEKWRPDPHATGWRVVPSVGPPVVAIINEQTHESGLILFLSSCRFFPSFSHFLLPRLMLRYVFFFSLFSFSCIAYVYFFLFFFTYAAG